MQPQTKQYLLDEEQELKKLLIETEKKYPELLSLMEKSIAITTYTVNTQSFLQKPPNSSISATTNEHLKEGENQ